MLITTFSCLAVLAFGVGSCSTREKKQSVQAVQATTEATASTSDEPGPIPSSPVPSDTAAAQMAQASGAPAVQVSLETPEHGGDTGLDLGASQRLKTVRALNSELPPSLREPENVPEDTDDEATPRPVGTPESIEDQINTSMTQTLKALNVKPPVSERGRESSSAFDDEEPEESKSGFFSRFKRS